MAYRIYMQYNLYMLNKSKDRFAKSSYKVEKQLQKNSKTYGHCIVSLSEDELNAELEKGFQEMLEGKTRPARQVFADIRKHYNI